MQIHEAVPPTFHSWVSHNAHLLLATTANTAAWIQSAVVGNISAGAVVTFCTIAVPAIGGAFIYVAKVVAPPITSAWLDYQERRDRMRASTLSGQMERLSRNLEAEQEQRKAALDLARLNADRAEASARLAADLSAMVQSLTAKVDEGNRQLEMSNRQLEQANRRIEDLNDKGHKLLNEANAKKLSEEADRLELQDKYAAAMAKIEELHATNEHLTRTVVDRVNSNTDRLDGIAAASAEQPADRPAGPGGPPP